MACLREIDITSESELEKEVNRLREFLSQEDLHSGVRRRIGERLRTYEQFLGDIYE